MKYFIVTGTSRGIGESLVRQLPGQDRRIFCISRTGNRSLVEMAEASNTQLSDYIFDLNNLDGIETLMEEIFSTIRHDSKIDGIYLINNAGRLAPVAPVQFIQADSMMENMTINLLAPMMLTAKFIKHAQLIHADKRILNISSASAKYLLPSQSCYSTSKAGLDSFSKSVSIEQSGREYPIKVVSVYPGMADTQMQAEIRSADKESFPDVEQFIQIAQEGKLQTPESAATGLLELLFSEDFGTTVIVEKLRFA